jgi:hypothetical protein
MNYVENPRSAGTPYWEITQILDIESTTGEYSDCVELAHQRPTSFAILVICPGVGIVEGVYALPTTNYYQEWELLSIER